MVSLFLETLLILSAAVAVGCLAGWVLRPLVIGHVPFLQPADDRPTRLEGLIEQLNAPFRPWLGLETAPATSSETVVRSAAVVGTSWFDNYFAGRQ